MGKQPKCLKFNFIDDLSMMSVLFEGKAKGVLSTAANSMYFIESCHYCGIVFI